MHDGDGHDVSTVGENGHHNHMQREEHGREQGHRIAPAHREREIAAERNEPDARNAHDGGYQVEHRGATLRDNPIKERHHDAIRRSKKRIAAGGRVGNANGLNPEAQKREHAKHDACKKMARIEVRTQRFMEHHGQNCGGGDEAHAHKPCGRYGIDGVFYDNEAEAPNNGGCNNEQLVEQGGEFFFHGSSFVILAAATPRFLCLLYELRR